MGAAPPADEIADPATTDGLDDTLDTRELLPVVVDDSDVDLEVDPVMVVEEEPELVLPRTEDASERREEATEEATDDAREDVKLLMMPPLVVVVCVYATCAERTAARRVSLMATIFAG